MDFNSIALYNDNSQALMVTEVTCSVHYLALQSPAVDTSHPPLELLSF